VTSRSRRKSQINTNLPYQQCLKISKLIDSDVSDAQEELDRHERRMSLIRSRIVEKYIGLKVVATPVKYNMPYNSAPYKKDVLNCVINSVSFNRNGEVLFGMNWNQIKDPTKFYSSNTSWTNQTVSLGQIVSFSDGS